jgi:hypothetical protein
MAALARSRAALRLFGADLRPEEITALLGAAPTSSHRRGEPDHRRRSARLRTDGGWVLEADDTTPADPDRQIAQILDQLTADPAVWQSLAARFKLDMFCGWFMDELNEGVSLSVASLRSLAERGILLDMDIYGGDGGSPPAEADPGQVHAGR